MVGFLVRTMKIKFLVFILCFIGLNVFGQSIPEYSRSEFGHSWADMDSDCLDTRQEILLRDSIQPAHVVNCRVVSGQWFMPYTDDKVKYTSNPRDMDIDHIIPLRWAWTRGEAWKWSKEKRVRFANDPDNLIAVDLSENRSKGARGPDQWLPPNEQYITEYINLWNNLVIKYWLTN